MKIIIKKARFALVMTLLSWQIPGLAEPLILTSPPRESPQAAEQLYGPLAQFLSKLTGTEIRYKYPGNWLRYQRDMRRNQFDIIFDGPHFASWRIKYYDHRPVAKLPGLLKFYLVARAQDETIKIPRDLAARKVCVIPPPNLSSLVLLARTDGPAREPILEAAKGGMKSVFQGLIDGHCEAAMLRASFYHKKLNDQQRAQVKIIYTSGEMPNQVITVSDRLTPEQQDKIAASLTSGEGIEVTRKIVTRFAGKKTKSFIPVKPGEFEGYNDLLEGVILGWKKHQ